MLHVEFPSQCARANAIFTAQLSFQEAFYQRLSPLVDFWILNLLCDAGVYNLYGKNRNRFQAGKVILMYSMLCKYDLFRITSPLPGISIGDNARVHLVDNTYGDSKLFWTLSGGVPLKSLLGAPADQYLQQYDH